MEIRRRRVILSRHSKAVKSIKILFQAGNGQIPSKHFSVEQYWLDWTYVYLFCLIILLTMRPLAVQSLILTGTECFFGSKRITRFKTYYWLDLCT